MLKKISFTSCVLLSLIGCAAALVPYTNDPKQKIADAYWLFDEKYRALPAEKLLHEAIDIYKNNNDEAGLADSYRAYAIFLRSRAVEKYSERYKERGFIEKSITYKNRYLKSIEFLNKSKEYYLTKQKYDELTNTYLHIGFTYAASNNLSEACNAFNKSIDANKAFVEKNPKAKIQLDGYKSYKDYIGNLMRAAKCKRNQWDSIDPWL